MLDLRAWIRRRAQAPREPGALVLDSLSDDRLRDLLGALLYTSIRWRRLRRLAGAERAAPDFVGEEDLGRDAARVWWVKVARPGSSGVVQLRRLVGEIAALHRPMPDVLLIAATGDVGHDEAAACSDAAASFGLRQAILWSRAEIETRLKQDRPDLVFAYFGAAPASRRTRAAPGNIRRRIEMKQRLLSALLMPADQRPAAVHPFDKFRYSHVIVRSIADESYPNLATDLDEGSGWYRLATYDALHDGLELLLGTDEVIRDGAGNWKRATARERRGESGQRPFRALRIGKLPFERVIEFDVDGDEYYRLPHLYCDFPRGGSPFASIRFELVDRSERE